MMFYTYLETPIGQLTLAGNKDNQLQYVLFPENRYLPKNHAEWHWKPNSFLEARQQLSEYFAGQRQQFTLELLPQGTPFQQQVWAKLATIPFGETWSYQQLAQAIENPKAIRAVGGANGRNPLPIILPCHRVIGANGTLTGFGGGLKIKAELLELESRYLNRNLV